MACVNNRDDKMIDLRMLKLIKFIVSVTKFTR